MSAGKAILVVDNDATVRHSMVALLGMTGFDILEAESTVEAIELIGKTDLALCIVDFKLPDASGISCISQIREAGYKTAIVFTSVSACDPNTFGYLRNILNVSLVLQKPVDPTLFLDQIEGLLPAERPRPRAPMTVSHTAAAASQHGFFYSPRTASVDGGASAPAAPAGVEHSQNPAPQPAVIEDSVDTAKLQEQLMQTAQKKSPTEEYLKTVQSNVANNLPAHWENLSKALHALQSDSLNMEKRERAAFMAHALKSAATTLGHTSLSNCAAKIEGHVELLNPNDPPTHNLLWLEIFRSLSDGEEELRIISQALAAAMPGRRVPVGRILIYGNPDRLPSPSDEAPSAVEARLVFADSPLQAAIEAASSHFDGAILDVSAAGGQVEAIGLTKELRMSGLNERLPVGYLLEKDTRMEAADRIFAGASVSLPLPITQQQLDECLIKLASDFTARQPTVLAVDDDKVSTLVIERVLTNNSIKASILNDPINILDTLEKLHPDVLLLDVMMPGLSGYDICRIVRATEKWSALPIIFLTAKDDPQSRSIALQAGGNDFLTKPIIPDDLLSRVNMQLKRARQDKEKQAAEEEAASLLREEAFMSRVSDLLVHCGRANQEMTLCLIRIDKSADHGMFSQINVFSTVGKMLHSRFPSEALRGVWSGGFSLAICNENWRAVTTAVERWAREVEKVQFSGESGARFSITVQTGIASYPADGYSQEALIAAASNRLEKKNSS